MTRIVTPDVTTMPTTTTLPDTTTQRPHPRRSGGRRTVFVAAFALTGTTLGVTSWHGLTGPGSDEQTTIRPTQQVDRIEIDVEAGDIEAGSGDKVIIDVATRSGGEAGASVTTSDLTDGVLTVSVSCPGSRSFGPATHR